MASRKLPPPLPPPPTEPGSYVLSADCKGWELETAAAEPVCSSEPEPAVTLPSEP